VSLLLIHLAATWALVGLIWFVQLVHYPLFSAVAPERFATFEAEHSRRTTWVVAVLMPAEAITGVLLAVNPPAGIAPWLAVSGLVLIALLWGTTLTVQVPLHRRLGDGYQAAVHNRLVRSNWIRTSLWSLRGIIVLVLAGQFTG
jgi:hypothetical protein